MRANKAAAGRFLNRWLPKSLASRFVLLLLIAVLSAQGLSSLVWVTQLKTRHHESVIGMASQIAYSISSTVRFFKSLPVDYRHIVLDQLRRLGGSRFFVTFNSEYINITPTPQSELKQAVLEEMNEVLKAQLGSEVDLHADFSLASTLHVFNNDIRLLDLPPGWGHHSLLLEPAKTPILVIQVGLKENEWLYLATLMPTPDGLLENDNLPADRLWFMGITIVLVMLVSLLTIRYLTRPLKLLSRAAEELGRDIDRPPIPESGSAEMVTAARTFNAMQERLRRYIEDRETLFSAISHDLKTPITRLRLRAELLEDEQVKGKFVQDLLELEHMVQGALQCVKDTAIHENPVNIDMNIMLQQICDGANLEKRQVSLTGLVNKKYWGKPLALKRAFTNLVDNAVFYGRQAEAHLSQTSKGMHVVDLQKPVNVHLSQTEEAMMVTIRDHGPGVAERDMERIFEPYVRLEKSRNRNTGGSGLGLSIVRNIIKGHGGEIRLRNHPGGGLVVEVTLPITDKALALD
ncbi:two-component sensor histidine kinase [Hahella sp. CCB-MM4]|uniref:ATP-binding protein n=1 Tax=Hahella sp. (strain CCB-MM4) TaxID=1926491 RepID=UPI000B9BB168|nr:ATP-binding protein [Hahella sp. CCB-MM4]OZG71387.1 two-component sensor histidine kinase [Hahella sp. CCB-MM4]